MNKASQQEIQLLLNAVEKDKKNYKELFDAGELNKPVYNTEMKKCHEENANLLEQFLNKYGWPFPQDYGEEAHEAAWFIAIHAISRPALIKKVARIMHDAWKAGKVSGKYYANFYDRIELYEGRKQLYGTHLYPSKNGWYAGDLKDPEAVNERRKALGLQSLEDWKAESEQEGYGFADVDEEAYQKEFDEWCKQTGWRNETPVWAQTIFIEQNLAKQLIENQFKIKVLSIDILGEGWDNIAYLINNEYVFRFPRRELGVDCIENEILILPYISTKVSFPFSCPTYIGKTTDKYPYSFAGYKILEGTPLSDTQAKLIEDKKFAQNLSSWLKELHSVPILRHIFLKLMVIKNGDIMFQLNWKNVNLEF